MYLYSRILDGGKKFPTTGQCDMGAKINLVIR